MKIAHISDLHLDIHCKNKNISDTIEVLEYITGSNFDHIIITGDITDRAEPTAFEMARSLFKKFGLLKPGKLTLAIGNHDIFGGVHFAEDVIEFPARCKNTNYNAKIKEFVSYFHESFEGTKSSNNSAFPFIKEFDEFVLAGINSIAKYSYLKNPFASNGKISKTNMMELTGLLESSGSEKKSKVILTHHHFCKELHDNKSETRTLWQNIEKQTMKLRNKKRILKTLKELGAELILHGHLHEMSDYTREDIRILNAGGTILSEDKAFHSVNSITIDRSVISNEVIRIPVSKATPANDRLPRRISPLYSKPQQANICLN